MTSCFRTSPTKMLTLLWQNEVQSLEDEPPHGSQSTDLNSAEDIHPSNSGSLAYVNGSNACLPYQKPNVEFFLQRRSGNRIRDISCGNPSSQLNVLPKRVLRTLLPNQMPLFWIGVSLWETRFHLLFTCILIKSAQGLIPSFSPSPVLP